MIRKIAVGLVAAVVTATGLSATTAAPSQAVTRNPTVFVVGDSISSKLFFNSSPGNSLEAWWSLLSRKSGATITGVSAQGGSGLIKRGNRTRSGEKCDGSTFGERLGEIRKSDYVVIEGGRNDYRRCSGSSSVGLTETEQSQGIQSYVLRLAARVDALGIPRNHVVFITPWGTNNADRKVFLQRTVAGWATKTGFLYAPTAQLTKSFSYDGTHPNRAGSDRIANEVLGFLRAHAGFGTFVSPYWRGRGPILQAAGKVGVPFSYQPVLGGNPKPMRFTRESGLFPVAGLTLDPKTGRIYGTPTTSGTYTVRFRASNGINPDAVQTITIKIAAGKFVPAPQAKPTEPTPTTETPTEPTPTTETPTEPTPTTETPTEPTEEPSDGGLLGGLLGG